MDAGQLTLLLFVSVVVLIFMGLPIAFCLAGVGLVFLVALNGLPSTATPVISAWNIMNLYAFICAPLFILMASMLQHSRVGDDLYNMMHHWMGGLRGGLAMGTVIICTVFAAMVATGNVGVLTMGLLALPAMLRRKYDAGMATGSIMAGSALGILIPPSGGFIIMGILANLSIGKLFMAGVFPGFLLAALFILYIGIRTYFQPRLGPSIPKEETVNFREKLVVLKGGLLPLGLIVLVLGSIFTGIATPTEAAGLGAVGAMVIALISGRLNWTVLKNSTTTTISITCMIMWLIVGAFIFTQAYYAVGGRELLENFFINSGLSRWALIFIMMGLLLIMGMFLDPVGIMLITIPIFLPLIESVGFDPIWFAVLYMINIEMAYLTPPFGLNLFYMKSVAPPEITMNVIYRSVLPFVGMQALGLGIVMVFPQIALWLPDKMIK